MCQNNIDNVQYNGDFKTKFSLIFCCSKYIVERLKHVSPYEQILSDSETESESEEREQSNVVIENENNVINNEDNVIELDDDDIECSENEDKDKYDSEVDDEED